MKNLLIFVLLLCCGALVLLATVDLEPYLSEPSQQATEYSTPDPGKQDDAAGPPPEPSPTTTQQPVPDATREGATPAAPPPAESSPAPLLAEQAPEARQIIATLTTPQDEQVEQPDPQLPPAEQPAEQPLRETVAQPEEETAAQASAGITAALTEQTTETNEQLLVTDTTQASTTSDSVTANERVPEAPPVGQVEAASGPAPDALILYLPRGEYPYSILLDTFADKQSAEQAVASYHKQGVFSHWVQVNLGSKGIWYRLFCGTFKTQSEAEVFRSTAGLQDKPIKMTRYTTLIGSNQDKATLTRDLQTISEAGFMPYLVETEDQMLLFVGAFYTKAGASDQCAALAETGLTCRPVERATNLQ